MIAAWMVYASAVTAFLLIGAAAVEKSLRLARCAGRWIVAAAIVTSVIVPIVTRSEPAAMPAGVADVAAPAQMTPLGRLTAILPDTATLQVLNLPLIVLWTGISIVLVALLLFAQASLSKRVVAYREDEVCGTRVFRSPALGPAVVGWLKSSIVLPAWVDHVGNDWRDLMVQHEKEHARCRDAQLLSLAALVVALQPWNLPLWCLLFRLRRAIELDCDQRILSSGVDVRLYGNLLLEVSRRRLWSPLPVVGLAVTRSFLARRVDAMTQHMSAFRFPKAVLSVAVGGALMAIAWELPAPVELATTAPPALLEVPEDTSLTSTIAGLSFAAENGEILTLQPVDEDLWRFRKALNAAAVLNSANVELIPADLVERLRNTAFRMDVTEEDGKPRITLRKVREPDGGASHARVLHLPIGQ